MTHVVLEQLCGGSIAAKWPGGGLSAFKIQKEISGVGGYGIKYVVVEWYGLFVISFLSLVPYILPSAFLLLSALFISLFALIDGGE